EADRLSEVTLASEPDRQEDSATQAEPTEDLDWERIEPDLNLDLGTDLEGDEMDDELAEKLAILKEQIELLKRQGKLPENYSEGLGGELINFTAFLSRDNSLEGQNTIARRSSSITELQSLEDLERVLESDQASAQALVGQDLEKLWAEERFFIVLTYSSSGTLKVVPKQIIPKDEEEALLYLGYQAGRQGQLNTTDMAAWRILLKVPRAELADRELLIAGESRKEAAPQKYYK
ncbi:MAG: hypothetical protein Q4P08_04850, partial [Eubacteriales bacterium]|nr:hypothetical protein [Eubacteriales bacterium]